MRIFIPWKGKIVEKSSFRISYDGPALSGGLIGVRQLAPSLLALADLIEGANNSLNGDRATVHVSIKSGFSRGSFSVDVEVWQNVLEGIQTISGLVSCYSPHDILNLIGIFAKHGISLIGLIRLLKGRRFRTEINLGKIEVKTDDAWDTINVEKGVVRLVKDSKIIDSLRGIVAPLESEGIDSLKTGDEDLQSLEVISREDVPYFDVREEGAEQEEVKTIEYDGWFELVDVSFEPAHKWRLSDGDTQISAVLSDAVFKQKIDNRDVSFSKGDLIKAKISRTQYRTEKQLRSQYEILKVMSRGNRAPQISLL